MHYRHYYSELAKLFYAISYADGSINPKEKDAIRSVVQQILVPAEKHVDQFATDAAYYVEIELDILVDTLPEPEVAFQSYLNFIEKHSTAIDRTLLETSLKAAKKISEASRGTNNTEASLIQRLERRISEIFTTV